MSKTNYTISLEIRNFIEYQIRYYPENKKMLAELKTDMIPSTIPKYGPQTGNLDTEQRPTEDIAIRIASDRYIFQLELTVSAIEAVYDKLTDIDKEIIRLKYWSGELTPEGIAIKLCMDKATMYRHLNAIITEVGRRLGYVDI